MERITDFVANLPAPVRHFAAIFIGAVFTVLAAAVTAAGGVTTVDWGTALISALDEAFVAALAGTGVLAATPLTNAYGVHKEQVFTDADTEQEEFYEYSDEADQDVPDLDLDPDAPDAAVEYDTEEI